MTEELNALIANISLNNELDVDLQSLNALIANDQDFSVVGSKAIFRVNNRNDELMRILLEERKKIMAQQIKHGREVMQWALI